MRLRNTTLALTITLGAAIACEEALTDLDDPDLEEVDERCDADNGGLTLPNGFCAAVVHDAMTPGGEPASARHIAVAPNGDVFVAIQSEGGGVLALRDSDDDGRADETALFGSGAGHGIAYREPYLYFAPNDRVERYLIDGDLMPAGGAEVIVSGMPDTGDHTTKSIVVTEDGSLFVNLGSASDVCQEENREPGSVGVDPCPELPERSGIWRYDADRTGQVQRVQGDGMYVSNGRIVGRSW
jgi:glucose/arabinose dehydrogenase